MTTTTTIPARCCGRCATSLGPSLVAQPTEGDGPVTPKQIAATLTLALSATTFVAPHAYADSRASRGMGRGPGPCMDVATATERAILWPESRGWPTADNPDSTAFGCGQLLRATRRAHYPSGCPLDTTSVACQMAGMRSYIRARYGTAGRALAARRTKGWY